jgi:DNA-binding response OmpR family regulator
VARPFSYSPPAPRAETVLIAEDDRAVRGLTKSILELEGYRVIEATNGLEAIAAAEDNAIDLLVTDLIMPGMHGKELATRLATIHGGLMVLFVSGFTDETIAPYSVLSPDDHYLAKPFSPDRLVLKVRELLRSRARRGAA